MSRKPHSRRDRYGRKKIQPKVRFRFRNIVIIFIACILIGLVYYMVKVNL